MIAVEIGSDLGCGLRPLGWTLLHMPYRIDRHGIWKRRTLLPIVSVVLFLG